MTNSDRNSDSPMRTWFGGMPWVPSAERTNPMTMTMRVNAVVMMSSAGRKVIAPSSRTIETGLSRGLSPVGSSSCMPGWPGADGAAGVGGVAGAGAGTAGACWARTTTPEACWASTATPGAGAAEAGPVRASSPRTPASSSPARAAVRPPATGRDGRAGRAARPLLQRDAGRIRAGSAGAAPGRRRIRPLPEVREVRDCVRGVCGGDGLRRPRRAPRARGGPPGCRAGRGRTSRPSWVCRAAAKLGVSTSGSAATAGAGTGRSVSVSRLTPCWVTPRA